MADETDLHVGKRLRRRRRLLGMTQQDLASQVGVRFQQIQKYECGANPQTPPGTGQGAGRRHQQHGRRLTPSPGRGNPMPA